MSGAGRVGESDSGQDWGLVFASHRTGVNFTSLRDGFHPYTIMALTGHSSAKMSAVYGHSSPDTFEAAGTRLEAHGDVPEFAVRQKSAIGGRDGGSFGETIPASG